VLRRAGRSSLRYERQAVLRSDMNGTALKGEKCGTHIFSKWLTGNIMLAQLMT
jgi:hypothetical protein